MVLVCYEGWRNWREGVGRACVCHAKRRANREAGETPALPAIRDGWVVARVCNDFVT